MNEIEVNIKNTIGSPFCVDAEDGEKIFSLLNKALKRGQKINLSFTGIELVITAFLNVAIGKLFKNFSTEEVDEYITVSDLDKKFQSTWNIVYNGAPLYYKNQEKFDADFLEIIEE